jgi:hypothetical protein
MIIAGLEKAKATASLPRNFLLKRLDKRQEAM